MLKAGTAAALAAAWTLGLVLATAGPASADAPTGNKLRWLPYRPSTSGAADAVRVAARDAQPRLNTSVNPVRQVQASPLDDPFGDAGSGSRAAAPVFMTGQAPSAPAMAPSGQDPAPAQKPVPAAPHRADDAAGSGDAATAAPPAPLERKPDAGMAPIGGKKKAIEFTCRPLKSLERIGDLTNSLSVPSTLKEYKFEIDKLACPLEDGGLPARELAGWQPTTFTWKASGLCHKPLYFQQAHVERYGHSTGPLTQPLVSGAMFFLTVPVLPYEMGLFPPYECIYTLGYYRPGSCAPYYLEPIPLSVRAGLIEAGAWLGAIYIIP